ncbi:ABC transporter ATP-binding protein [Alkalibacillus aidingensis]|uniref:ABC transporter ATP-binding protein n=1 Tax=Alkalibacillus aidingensis TaxID=2747607 RepID=UPI00166166A2|nr:ABC transporter ATP-binding protein [Alkalibacillus aidingensis]
MIRLDDVGYKKKGKHILEGVNAHVEAGDSICLFGPNGAGKSTLLKVMANLIKPTVGVRHFHPKEEKHPIGYIPQQVALFNNLTVKDHLRFYQKMTKKHSTNYIEEMKLKLGLNEILSKRVDQLSGGMMRKVNLAVGLLHEPEIVFLDEAFVGVDLAAKHDMLKWLNQLNERGVTVVFVTHDWHVINQLAKKMWILEDGRITDQVKMSEINHLSSQKIAEGTALSKMFALRMQ